MPWPSGVVTEIRPDVALVGTLVEIEVAVAAVMAARVPLNFARLLCVVVSKFSPVTVTAVPAAPIFGVKPVTTGPVAATTNGTSLASEPAAMVTEISPVVAPAGTVVTICVSVAEETTAAVPLKLTVLLDGVVLKPVPEMVTTVPANPDLGVNSRIDTRAELWREIERR